MKAGDHVRPNEEGCRILKWPRVDGNYLVVETTSKESRGHRLVESIVILDLDEMKLRPGLCGKGWFAYRWEVVP